MQKMTLLHWRVRNRSCGAGELNKAWHDIDFGTTCLVGKNLPDLFPQSCMFHGQYVFM